MAKQAIKRIQEWKDQGSYFDWEGHQIFFRDSGGSTKPVLLLLHGFPTSSYDWRDIWSDLTQTFRVLSFDFLGFGLSDKPKLGRYSIMMQADIAESLLHKSGVANYHLLAHDYGDTVAQELLARDQDDERGLIQSCLLLNGGLFPETHKPLLLQRLLISPVGPLISRLASFRKFVNNFDTICIQEMPVEELRVHWELLTRANGRAVMPKVIRYMDERVRYRERWVGALINSRIPLRLINGLDDPISGGHMADRYEQLVPGADIVGLASVGHYPQNESASAVLAAASEFWKVLEQSKQLSA